MGFGGTGLGGFRGSGGGMPAPTGNDGYALVEVGGVAAFRPIQGGYVDPAFGVSGFNLASLSQSQEVGDTVTDPALNASYTGAPDTAEVVDDQGNPALDVSATPNNFTYSHAYTKTANNAAVLLTLSAVKGAESGSRNLSVYWRPRGYWGIGPAGINTQTGIKSLANQPLMASRALAFSAVAGGAQYIYFAVPVSYGPVTFFVDGWEGGFEAPIVVPVTNDFGVTQNYNLYRSTNPNLGSTAVQAV